MWRGVDRCGEVWRSVKKSEEMDLGSQVGKSGKRDSANSVGSSRLAGRGKVVWKSIWKSGNLEIWKSGNLEIWKSGNLEIWKSGNLEINCNRNPSRPSHRRQAGRITQPSYTSALLG